MSKNSHLSLVSLLRIVIPSAFVCLASCSTVDPQYTQKIGSARSNCKGDEIVGVWLAAEEIDGSTAVKKTLLIRPNGTGLFRHFHEMLVNPYEYHISWSYDGNGVWRAVYIDVSDNTIKQFDSNAIIRYTGNELLIDDSGSGIVSQDVYVRSQL